MKYKIALSLSSGQYLVFRELGNDLFLLLNAFNSENDALDYAKKLEELDR